MRAFTDIWTISNGAFCYLGFCDAKRNSVAPTIGPAIKIVAIGLVYQGLAFAGCRGPSRRETWDREQRVEGVATDANAG